MENIQKIHEDVFIFLQEWSEKERQNESTLNPYFYMRKSRDERFRSGFWFPGNDNYLCISFWEGGDTYNKTPNVFFEINEKKGCRSILVSRDSAIKFDYFSSLAEVLNRDVVSGPKYELNQKRKSWIKTFSPAYNDYLKWLHQFILIDKMLIDQDLKKNKPEMPDEYTIKFDFIPNSQFDNMLSQVISEKEKLEEQKKQTETTPSKKLIFTLSKIDIENFQGIKKTTISDLPQDAQWIFITGENGYGKTSILRAIALGLNNDYELEKYYDDPKTRFQLELIHHNEKAVLISSKNSPSNKINYDFNKYNIGYGPARLNVQAISSENQETKSKNNVAGLFDNSILLKNINYELFASNFTEEKLFNHLKTIIKNVTNERISDIIFRGREVLFAERLEDGNINPLPLSSLAAGFRSIINMVFDIYIRYRNTTLFLEPEKFYGIVFIDELENHLHPIIQKELPITLSKVFPEIQFIATTHSPIPLLGAPKNSVILKANRTVEEGITIERLDDQIDFWNLLPNTILTSPIFGFDGIISVSNENITDINTEDSYDEAVTMNKLKNSLKILKPKENL